MPKDDKEIAELTARIAEEAPPPGANPLLDDRGGDADAGEVHEHREERPLAVARLDDAVAVRREVAARAVARRADCRVHARAHPRALGAEVAEVAVVAAHDALAPRATPPAASAAGR